jgi:hypothetical protein
MPISTVQFADFSNAASVADARKAMAWYAQFAMYAEDMYVNDASDPKGDSRFDDEWQFVDWLRTTVAANILGDIEHLLFGANETTYFGALLRNRADSNQYLVTIRGTESGPEWIQNFVAAPDLLHNAKLALASALIRKSGKARQHRSGGLVPDGFYGIYDALTLGGANVAAPAKAASGLVAKISALQAVGGSTLSDAVVTIVGHSLGAAVSTYLAYDLAQPVTFGKVHAYLFASPHPGDAVYAQHFSATGVNCVSVVYDKDLVPKVPPLYVPLKETVTILAPGSPNSGANQILSPTAIEDSPGGNHHAICYAAMLDPAVARAIVCYTLDQDCVSCIDTDSSRPAIRNGSSFPAPPWGD